jgi:3-phenylpropionate/trans-cinnamate dioxygenase ferredoxin reductase subunit
VLVGGGIASANCAAELRRQGADGSILLVSREPDPPYDRPPLSKEYLRGESTRGAAHLYGSDWYERNDVELMLSTSVLGLDAELRSVTLQTKEQIEFGRALLAPGAMVNRIRAEGAGLEGLHYLRTFGNADAIRESARRAQHVVLVGGSYIAAEVAASLTTGGVRCTMVMAEETVLERTLGPVVGRVVQQLLEARGVGVVPGRFVTAFGGDGVVEAVMTADGTVIEGDMVVLGTGVKPDQTLARRAGLELDDGIACDAALETSAPGVFAAGDACSWFSRPHGRRLRVEHTDAAARQGRHVARAMLGHELPYAEVPYFSFELADWASFEYVGWPDEWDRVVLSGDPADGHFSAWYSARGRLTAMLAMGRSEEVGYARDLLAADVDPRRHEDLLARLDAGLEPIAAVGSGDAGQDRSDRESGGEP